MLLWRLRVAGRAASIVLQQARSETKAVVGRYVVFMQSTNAAARHLKEEPIGECSLASRLAVA